MRSEEAPTSDTFMPWWDTTKWKPGEWYPMPFGFMARDNPRYIIEGYQIYELDASTGALSGDITPAGVMGIGLLFSEALSICERHNGRVMIP